VGIVSKGATYSGVPSNFSGLAARYHPWSWLPALTNLQPETPTRADAVLRHLPRCQRLLKIGNDIVHMLDTDRQPDQVRGDACAG